MINKLNLFWQATKYFFSRKHRYPLGEICCWNTHISDRHIRNGVKILNSEARYVRAPLLQGSFSPSTPGLWHHACLG